MPSLAYCISRYELGEIFLLQFRCFVVCCFVVVLVTNIFILFHTLCNALTNRIKTFKITQDMNNTTTIYEKMQLLLKRSTLCPNMDMCIRYTIAIDVNWPNVRYSKCSFYMYHVVQTLNRYSKIMIICCQKVNQTFRIKGAEFLVNYGLCMCE